MAIYAVGDIQGCRDELERLLEVARFDPARDAPHREITVDHLLRMSSRPPRCSII